MKPNMIFLKLNILPIITLLFPILTILIWQGEALAAQVRLTWTDKSTNETGFKIERKAGITGTFVQIAVVTANVTSYTDAAVADGTAYCYRVRAYNRSGDSPFVEACATTTNAGQSYIWVDRDGNAQLIIARADNSFWGSRSTGRSFTSPQQWVQHGGEYLAGRAAQYADVNGDGKADLIYQSWNNAFWVSLSTGNGFTPPAWWAQHGGTFAAGQAQYADVNGDGKADLIFQSWNNAFWVSISTGTGFKTPLRWVQHGDTFFAGQAQYADVNGDGKADLIFQGVDNTFWVSLSTGNGFTSPAWWIQHGGTFTAGQAQYADINGDGKADLIFQGADYSFWVSQSTKFSFKRPQLWLQF
jgi:hypothetical protein